MGIDLTNEQSIYQKLTRVYLRILEAVERGGVCKHCGAVNEDFIVINPAVLGHVNKFLAQNEIGALPVKGSDLDRLQQKGKVINLPFVEPHERLASGE